MKNTSYLLRGTPSVLLFLGAGFIMASSSDVRAAIGMGVAVLVSLVLTSVVVSAIHKLIPAYAKLPAYLLIITGFVSLISMLMEAYFPDIVDMLGIHLAALSVSAVVYRDAEEVADHCGEGRSIITAVVTGVFITVIMTVCAVIRELLGNAAIFGKPVEFLADYKISVLASTFGGYLILALVVALINKLTGIHKEEKEDCR